MCSLDIKLACLARGNLDTGASGKNFLPFEMPTSRQVKGNVQGLVIIISSTTGLDGLEPSRLAALCLGKNSPG